MTALVRSRGLVVSYGRRAALRGLDADVPEGRVVAVLGENGSGKSTLLKAIARIVTPDSGELSLEGRPLRDLPRRATARRIAYVPQSVELVFPIRCLDLVLQGRAPHGRGFAADSASDRELALRAMEACDVLELAERDASALSGGERRRVFLARALAQEAEIWLLDEPTSGLDPRHRLEFLAILARAHRDRAATVLFVTHEIELAAEIADSVLLLKEGRAIAQGSPREVLTESHFLEGFGIDARLENDETGRPRLRTREPGVGSRDSGLGTRDSSPK